MHLKSFYFPEKLFHLLNFFTVYVRKKIRTLYGSIYLYRKIIMHKQVSHQFAVMGTKQAIRTLNSSPALTVQLFFFFFIYSRIMGDHCLNSVSGMWTILLQLKGLLSYSIRLETRKRPTVLLWTCQPHVNLILCSRVRTIHNNTLLERWN